MAWLCVDDNVNECMFDVKPSRNLGSYYWECSSLYDNFVELPKGTIEKIIGRVLTWDDEPVEI